MHGSRISRVSKVTPQAAMDAAWQEMDGPFVWGVRDCITTAGRTFFRLHGIDPLPVPDWHTGRGAWRHIRRMGGMVQMGQIYADRASLMKSGATPGAIGLVPVSNGWPLAFGICLTPTAWAVFAGHGLTITEVKPIVAWGPKCRN